MILIETAHCQRRAHCEIGVYTVVICMQNTRCEQSISAELFRVLSIELEPDSEIAFS